jgi:hypothetical protein
MLSNAQAKNASTAKPGPRAGFMIIEAPRHLAVWTGAVFVLVLAAAGALGYWLATERTRASGAAVSPANTLSDELAPTYAARPGPWGEIFCQRSVIEVPVDYLGLRGWEAEPVQWFFRDYSPGRLKQFLARLEFSTGVAQELLAETNWSVTAEGIFVRPGLEAVLALTPAVRNELYAELGKFEENVMQHQPFHWTRDESDQLFASSRATPESIAVFRGLCYERGRYLLFSDWQALLRALPDAAERNAVAQSLMGRFVLFASVRVTPQTDVTALVRYWGGGESARDIRPILEAAARVPEGLNLSLANLLPPHIRAQLNTFPFAAPNEQWNCHWTTFNFFHANPEPPAGVRYWRNKLQTDYVPVTGPPRYGDVLLLLKPDNTWVHSCVYLADEMVYTKNGGSPFAPWQLSTIADVVAFYSWDLPEHATLKQSWYRKRS